MANLSEKYIAGFTDSDGSIQVMWRALDRADADPSMRRPYLSLEWTQISCNNEVLHRIKESVGGTIYTREKTKGSTLKLFGSPAVQLLYRMKQYLVVKRRYAEVVLELLGKPQKVETAKAYLKIQRRIKSSHMPNYPSRKWLAGYFDGDGSFQARIGKGRTSAQLVAAIVASDYDAIGLELIAKVFGGSLQTSPLNGGAIARWILTMPPSKVEQFVGYFAKELIVKKDQADFMLGCARMGHFHDGESIQATLKQLKARPHRLNEPKNDIPALVANVKDIPSDREASRQKFAETGRCGCGSLDHYCNGVCRKCYDKLRHSKR